MENALHIHAGLYIDKLMQAEMMPLKQLILQRMPGTFDTFGGPVGLYVEATLSNSLFELRRGLMPNSKPEH